MYTQIMMWETYLVSHAIEFVETSIFTKQIKELATDDELKELQAELIAQPEKGDIIKGTGGLRKVRMAVGNKGKSGSVRVLYVLVHADKIFLVLAYPKSVKDSLTNAEKTKLKQLVQSLKGEGI
ncbi:TPA: type II toxin-antitoxin system RelE/ParE family toxin [Vibrio parahaemolyticus]